jgi:hypothetical protein
VAVADLSRYWITAEHEPEPFTEFDGIRFRRSATMVELEMETSHGGWIRWWVEMEAATPYAVVALTDDLSLAQTLGAMAAGSAGARLLEQTAADAVALARYGAGMVDGCQLVSMTWPSPTPGGAGNSVLMSPLTSRLKPPYGSGWLDPCMPFLSAAQSVVNACGLLQETVAALGPAQRAALVQGPHTDWRASLRNLAQVSADAKKILDLVSTAQKVFGG